MEIQFGRGETSPKLLAFSLSRFDLAKLSSANSCEYARLAIAYNSFIIRIYSNMNDDIKKLALEWVSNDGPVELPEKYYCETRDIFQARIDNMIKEMIAVGESSEGDAYMAGAVAGEIGNNSFDHNIGNWPDMAGIFFGYKISNEAEIVLGDRGRGVMETLKRVKPEITSEQEAIKIAFFEKISGRAPEVRGNGLKFVRESVKLGKNHLTFISGDAKAELNNDFDIGLADNKINGCLVIIKSKV